MIITINVPVVFMARYVMILRSAVPEIVVTVFAKTSPKRSFSMTEYERFGFVFTKTLVYKFGHCCVVLCVIGT
jgi:hypothetical protein